MEGQLGHYRKTNDDENTTSTRAGIDGEFKRNDKPPTRVSYEKRHLQGKPPQVPQSMMYFNLLRPSYKGSKNYLQILTTTVFYVFLWGAILQFHYTIGATRLPHIPATHGTNLRKGNERNVMLVLPVVQGSNDPNDPRLEFWYTKPPVTVVIEDEMHKKKSKLKSTTPTSFLSSFTPPSTKQYSEPELVTVADIITTNTPFLDHELHLNEQKLNIPRPQQHPILPSNNKDMYVSFVKDPIKYSPPPNLHIISAEPKWKNDIHKLIESDKLKAQNAKPTLQKTTVLPSTTRIHYYSDFVPIDTNHRQSSLKPQTVIFKNVSEPPKASVRFPTTEEDSQYDFIKIYDMMKKVSLKPLSHSKSDQVEPISSDRAYFDVLREIVVPTESLFKERTKPQTIPSSSSKVVEMRASPSTSLMMPEQAITENLSIGEHTSTIPTSISSQALPTSDKLTDDFKLMLVSLGILQDNSTTTTTTESNELWMDPENFTIDPHSYVKFKKIPINEELPPIRKDMQFLLNSFGLLPKTKEEENFTSSRVARQIRDKVPKSTLSNGVIKKTVTNVHKQLVEVKAINISDISNTSTTKVPISAPKTSNISSTELPISTSPTSTMLKPSTQTPKPQQPLGFKFSEQTTSNIKVKRKSSTTTEKAKRTSNSSDVSYEDLAASFGGGETASDDPLNNQSTEPNGLYFFVDWNSFLNVADDDDEKPIRLRFSPRVGNARLFVPVDIP